MRIVMKMQLIFFFRISEKCKLVLLKVRGGPRFSAMRWLHSQVTSSQIFKTLNNFFKTQVYFTYWPLKFSKFPFIPCGIFFAFKILYLKITSQFSESSLFCHFIEKWEIFLPSLWKPKSKRTRNANKRISLHYVTSYRVSFRVGYHHHTPHSQNTQNDISVPIFPYSKIPSFHDIHKTPNMIK